MAWMPAYIAVPNLLSMISIGRMCVDARYSIPIVYYILLHFTSHQQNPMVFTLPFPLQPLHEF
jgi:hypothetical protein